MENECKFCERISAELAAAREALEVANANRDLLGVIPGAELKMEHLPESIRIFVDTVRQVGVLADTNAKAFNQAMTALAAAREENERLTKLAKQWEREYLATKKATAGWQADSTILAAIRARDDDSERRNRVGAAIEKILMAFGRGETLSADPLITAVLAAADGREP